jgi:hypothetical protein
VSQWLADLVTVSILFSPFNKILAFWPDHTCHLLHKALNFFQGRRGLDLGNDDGGAGDGLRAQLQQGRPRLRQGLQAPRPPASHRRRRPIRPQTGNGLEVEVFFKVYLHNPTDCVVRQKEDPICENCVVRHFQMSYDKIFTYICEVV